MKVFSKIKIGHALGVLAIALPVFSPMASTAQGVSADFDPGRYRIDIAGRQRMLTQRMAKAVCNIHEGHVVDMHLEMLANDYHLFSDTLNILIDGGGEHDLEPENDRRTLEELGHVLTQWARLSEIVDHAIKTGTVSEEDLGYVSSHDLELLEDSDHAVSLIEQNYANPNTLNMATAITLNIFGRQRMLAQQSAKGYCYVASGHNNGEETANLEEARSIFSVSLDAIRFGLPEMGIAPPPTDEIAAQLGVVAEIWQGMDAVFRAAIAGTTPTEEEITFIAIESMQLQNAMNTAVQMYIDN